MFSKLKKKLLAWVEGLLYYGMSDEERNEYTAVYNRQSNRKAREGYRKRDSDDFRTSIEGYLFCAEARDDSIAHEEMIKKCLFFEALERTIKELNKRVAEDRANKE